MPALRSWTDDLDDELCALLEQGLTYGTIADRLGFASRSAINGWVNRLRQASDR